MFTRPTAQIKRENSRLREEVDQLSDRSSVGVAAHYSSLALATGDEGLWELDLKSSSYSDNNIWNIADADCTSCAWVYHSIVGSSHVSSKGLLAQFSNDYSPESETKMRKLQDKISTNEIFGTEGYTWGQKDKLCQLGNKKLRIMKYAPFAESQEDYYYHLGVLEVPISKKDLVSARTAHFGTIIETHDALYVFRTDNEVTIIPGEPIMWRIFPDSVDYRNQLHVIYPNHMCIWSFNHDYFVEQKSKLTGAFYNPITQN